MTDEPPSIGATVDINYLKSGDFREVACDGVLGGPTPQGKVWLAFYTERFPLPRIMRYRTKEGDQPGHVIIDATDGGEMVDGRQGIIRNVEFGVYMSVENAQQLHEWLGQQLATMTAQGESQQ